MLRSPVSIAVIGVIGLFLARCVNEGDSSLPNRIPTQGGPTALESSPTADSVSTGGSDATSALLETPSIPLPTPFPDTPTFSIGQSVEGRTISGWQFGDGATTLMLIGGIHAGYEANTVWLSNLLIQHFQRNPEDILPGIRLIIIPLANPDGIMRGDKMEGRLNARGVDLNRNWGCEWSEQAYLGDTSVNPGPRPFSEPETLALRTYFLDQKPSAVLFYHSAIGGIFLGACRGQSPGVEWMGKLLSRATGYPYERSFNYYQISGDATNWLAERGIPSAVIELLTKDQPELRENLNGVIALECHFVLEGVANARQLPAVQRLCTSE